MSDVMTNKHPEADSETPNTGAAQASSEPMKLPQPQYVAQMSKQRIQVVRLTVPPQPGQAITVDVPLGFQLCEVMIAPHGNVITKPTELIAVFQQTHQIPVTEYDLKQALGLTTVVPVKSSIQ